MRSRRAILGLLTLGALAIAASMPAGATSAYHMNGQGSLTMGGGGLPSCLADQGDCDEVDISFSWGELTVQGVGPLQDQNVAGQYRCRSEGSNFQSRIRGNTSNFELTFNFQCESLTGVGPKYINGWFSNVTSNAGGAYHSVADHPHPTPVAPGAPAFKGYFFASESTNIDPDLVNESNGDPMSCGGGFAPTGMNGLRIQTAAFLGACTALAA